MDLSAAANPLEVTATKPKDVDSAENNTMLELMTTQRASFTYAVYSIICAFLNIIILITYAILMGLEYKENGSRGDFAGYTILMVICIVIVSIPGLLFWVRAKSLAKKGK